MLKPSVFFLILFFLLSCSMSKKVTPEISRNITEAVSVSVEKEQIITFPEDAVHKTRPILFVFPFVLEEDNVSKILSSTVCRCIELNIRLTGKYDIAENISGIDDNFSTDSIKAFCYEKGIDCSVYGEITKTSDAYTIDYSIYDTAADSLSYSGNSSIESVLEIFDASDEISDNILSRLSDTPLTFGSFEIRTVDNDAEKYQVFLNNIEIPVSSGGMRLITGEYSFRLVDRSTMETLVTENISVRENEKTCFEMSSLKKETECSVITIPERTIKIDGKSGDWKGIDPLFTDQSDDKAIADGSGYDIIEGYVCHDEKYLYWMMVFADRSPVFPREAWTDKYDLVIGGYGKTVNENEFWDYSIGYDLEVNRIDREKVASEIWSQSGKKRIRSAGMHKTGSNFIEAAFKLSLITDFDHTEMVQAWMRVWRWDNYRHIRIDETERKNIIIAGE